MLFQASFFCTITNCHSEEGTTEESSPDTNNKSTQLQNQIPRYARNHELHYMWGEKDIQYANYISCSKIIDLINKSRNISTKLCKKNTH